MSKMIYEITIELNGTDPKIWRRIQVNSDISLNELHHIIQITMGWTNSHLYSFTIDVIEYSLKDYDYDNHKYGNARAYRIKEFKNEPIEYLYDFGDYWEHSVQIVKEVKDERLLHPKCIEGEGTCPPEDVGGMHGFEEFKAIMRDKRHPERKSNIEWYGSEFDPDKVNLEEINRQLTNLTKYMREIESDNY
jgi:hypothetical protein